MTVGGVKGWMFAAEASEMKVKTEAERGVRPLITHPLLNQTSSDEPGLVFRSNPQKCDLNSGGNHTSLYRGTENVRMSTICRSTTLWTHVRCVVSSGISLMPGAILPHRGQSQGQYPG